MSTNNVIETMVTTFALDTVNEQLVHLGYDEVGKDNKDLGCALIAMSIKGKESAVATFHDLYRGNGSVEAIQKLLTLAYPSCSHVSAANQLCRFRNPDKYRPKTMPRYAVSGGRGGRVSGAAISMDKGLADRLATFMSSFKK